MMKKFLVGIIMALLIGSLVGMAAGGALPPPGGGPPPAAPATRMFYLSQGHSYGFTGDIYQIEGDTIWLLPQGLEKKDVEYFGEKILLKIRIGKNTELFRINQRGKKEWLTLQDLKTDQRITTAVIWQWNGKEAQRIQVMKKP
jgi:hypothetical protein